MVTNPNDSELKLIDKAQGGDRATLLELRIASVAVMKKPSEAPGTHNARERCEKTHLRKSREITIRLESTNLFQGEEEMVWIVFKRT